MPRTKRSERLEHAPDGRRVYSLGDAQALTGATRARSELWLKSAVIVPDYPGTGSGNFHGFTFRNLVEFSVARALADVGFSIDAIRGALEGLRVRDKRDWYTEMPKMSAAIDAVKFKGKPTTAQAMAWVEEQVRKYGVGGGRFTDPKWVAEADRFLPLAGMPEERGELSAAEIRTLKRWRRFKNPATRGKLTAILCCGNHAGWLAFNAEDAWKLIVGRPGLTTLDLGLYFKSLETKTLDAWEGAPPSSNKVKPGK